MNSKRASSEPVTANANTSANETKAPPSLPARAQNAIAAGDFAEALRVLGKEGNAPISMNARAVCLLRLGRYAEALQVYRTFVLSSGGIFFRPDTPDLYKANYALTLLLLGLPSGGLAALADLDPKDERVIRLRAVVKAWEKNLPWWPWLNWKFGRIDPPNHPIPIDFAPGEFESTQS